MLHPARQLMARAQVGRTPLPTPAVEFRRESLTYVTTAAYFATRIAGAQIYDAGNPDPGLDGDRMIRLQERLAASGHDVGNVDGILGARTRAAVQAEQARQGLPADAWPTRALLDAL